MRRGRPKLSDEERRGVRIPVHLTADEAAPIKAFAKLKRIPLAQAARMLLTGVAA